MKHRLSTPVGLAALALASITTIVPSHAAVFASAVVSYTPGAGASLTDSSTALGQPDPIVGAGSGFDSILSPFSPHFEGSQLVQISEGGSITLQLANYAVATGGSAEIGIFTNAGFGDQNFPNGLVADDLSGAFTTFGIDSARVEVSADGSSWFDYGNLLIDQPASYFTDAPIPFAPVDTGFTPADFGQPHGNSLNDFAGQDWNAVKAALGNSAGGYWLDLDASGMAQVGWIRFSLADDGDAGTDLSFELDAVSIANASVGAAIPEPSSCLLLLLGLTPLLRRKR